MIGFLVAFQHLCENVEHCSLGTITCPYTHERLKPGAIGEIVIRKNTREELPIINHSHIIPLYGVWGNA